MRPSFREYKKNGVNKISMTKKDWCSHEDRWGAFALGFGFACGVIGYVIGSGVF